MKAKNGDYAKGRPRKLATGKQFPFVIRPLEAEEGGGFLIEFPDLPGCISDGETIEQAIENGMDAKAAWLRVQRSIAGKTRSTLPSRLERKDSPG